MGIHSGKFCVHVAPGPLAGLYKIEPSYYGSTYKIPVCYTQQATYLYFIYPCSNPQCAIGRVCFTFKQICSRHMNVCPKKYENRNIENTYQPWQCITYSLLGESLTCQLARWR